MIFKRKHTEPLGQRRVQSLGHTNAFAYHSRRSQERAALGRHLISDTNIRAAKRAGNFWMQRFGLVAIIIVTIISLISVLSLSTNPKIVQVDNSPLGYLHNEATYQRAASQLLAGSILNRNKITVDVAGISAAMKRQFPELAVVSVNLPLLGQRPLIYIQSAEPILLLATTKDQTFVIDSNGYAVGDGSVPSALASTLATVQDQSGTTVHLGQQFLSSDDVAFVSDVIYQLREKGIGIAGFMLPSGKGELDMRLTGQSYSVKFNLESPAVDQEIGTFLAVRRYLAVRGIIPSNYIDVRVDGRAYYK